MGKGKSNRYKKTAAPKVRQLFILFTAFSDAVVDIGDEGIDVDAVSTGTLTDGFKVSSHAADAAKAVLLEDFDDLRVFLNGFNNTRIFGNLCHSIFLLLR